MRIIIKDNYQDLSKKATEIIKQRIEKKSNLVLGLATGSTPLGCYQGLIEEHKKGLDFSKVIAFNLDEYLNLPPEYEQSYSYFLHKNLFDHINIDQKNIHLVSGIAKNVRVFCQEYEQKLQEIGGIDLQVLGIGSDGHIGFNEPGIPFDSRTRVAKLAESTIKDNSRFF